MLSNKGENQVTTTNSKYYVCSKCTRFREVYDDEEQTCCNKKMERYL